jgi:hypothetical protein
MLPWFLFLLVLCLTLISVYYYYSKNTFKFIVFPIFQFKRETGMLLKTAKNPAIESVALTTDSENPAELSTVGTVMFKAEAAGGTGHYEYQFWMRSSSNPIWEIVQVYSDENTYYWTPYRADTCYITVWVRSAGRAVNFETKKMMMINVVD